MDNFTVNLYVTQREIAKFPLIFRHKLIKIKIKLRSFRCSEQINEKGDGPYLNLFLPFYFESENTIKVPDYHYENMPMQ